MTPQPKSRRYLSVCSGIEAASVAFEPLGWTPLAFAEIAEFPRCVLAHHYPDVPLYGDFTLLQDMAWIGQADVLVGGTPCQSFSVAGLRGGLSDSRGNLTLKFVRLANAIDDLRPAASPATILWENVRGVLSTRDNAFGALLGALAGCDAAVAHNTSWPGAGVVAGPDRIVAWRVLDAQYFGVAQRRRRVFVLARGRAAPCGGWSVADALLPLTEGGGGDTAPRRESREDVAGTLASRTSGGGFPGTDEACGGFLTYSNQEIGEFAPNDVASTLRKSGAKGAPGCEALVAFHPTQDPISSTDGTTHALGCGSSKGQATVAVASTTGVRRLTPIECERLQGFPDGYTAIAGDGTPDSPRYKALGNSMAVPVMAWIGKRIDAVRQA
jgi:DNA (cytosine-5)-methyltransferase 1